MSKIIILGSQGSGKKALQASISSQMPDYQFDVYASGFSCAYDAAILVISLLDGPMPQTMEHLLMARKGGIPNIFCFLNKNDRLTEEELKYLVLAECRDLARKYGYSKDNFFMVAGSALQTKEVQQLARLIQDNIKSPYKNFDFKFPEYKCRKCGHIEQIPFDACKACNQKQKTSLMEKIFGKRI